MAKHFAFIKIKCISFANCHRKYFKTISQFYHNFVSKMEFGFIIIPNSLYETLHCIWVKQSCILVSRYLIKAVAWLHGWIIRELHNIYLRLNFHFQHLYCQDIRYRSGGYEVSPPPTSLTYQTDTGQWYQVSVSSNYLFTIQKQIE